MPTNKITITDTAVGKETKLTINSLVGQNFREMPALMQYGL